MALALMTKRLTLPTTNYFWQRTSIQLLLFAEGPKLAVSEFELTEKKMCETHHQLFDPLRRLRQASNLTESDESHEDLLQAWIKLHVMAFTCFF